MDNKKMAALNEDQLEKVDGGTGWYGSIWNFEDLWEILFA